MNSRLFSTFFILLVLTSTLLMLHPYNPVAATPDGTQSLPRGHFVARVHYDTIGDIDRLAEYDVWEYNNLDEQYVLVSLDALAYAELTGAGWSVAVDEAATQLLNPPAWLRPFYDGYRTTAEISAEILRIQAENPAITTVIDYGDSFCKLNAPCVTLGGDAQPAQDLLAIRVTNPAVAGSSAIVDGRLVRGTKPVFFLMANIHSREITTPEIALRMLNWLVDGYGRDPDATWLVDWHEIWIVPTANPDGHWLVELGEQPPYNGAPFYQRKNMNRDSNQNGQEDCAIWPPSSSLQYGVDLNRNHSMGYGGSGSSSSPCSATFRGAGPASEPEVAALQALVTALIPDQRGNELTDPAPADTRGLFITLHSYSELVLYPWGYSSTPAPNQTGLAAIANKLASYNRYRACQPPICLYAASGTSDDWAYGELGIPAFTFEMGRAFMPPYSEIESVQWPANGPALQYAARIAYQPYTQVLGPDVVELSLAELENGRVRISAEIDITNTQAVIVSGATATIDQPFWADGAELIALTPDENGYGRTHVAASAEIDTTALTPGRHMLMVQGQGQSGNNGAISAIFFNVADLERPYRVYTPLLSR